MTSGPPYRFIALLRNPSAALRSRVLVDEGLEDLALMIDRPPEIVSCAIDPDENFVQMSAPLYMGAH